MTSENKPIRIAIGFVSDGSGIVPKGIQESFIAEIKDEITLFKFNRSQFTKAYAKEQEKKGIKSKYIERLQKTACYYPKQTKEQIYDQLKKDFDEVGVDIDQWQQKPIK